MPCELDRSTAFVGDLDDPWARALAEVLPEDSPRFDCPQAWPDDWPSEHRIARTLVLHRRFLRGEDNEWLARERRRRGTQRLLLCVGDLTRFHQVEHSLALADAVLTETTALEVLPVRLGTSSSRRADIRTAGGLGTVLVVSRMFELRQAWLEACRDGGLRAEGARDWGEAPPCEVALWDVPVLDPGWERDLARAADRSAVVALCGFADRTFVEHARSLGASACLDTTCEIGDLIHVLRRVAAGGRTRCPESESLV